MRFFNSDLTFKKVALPTFVNPLTELRRQFVRFLPVFIVIGFMINPLMQESATAQGNPINLQAYWDNGLTFENQEEDIELSIGGRIQQDWTFISMDEELENQFNNPNRYATGFRRARLFQDGSIGPHFNYKIQFDFAGGSADVKDLILHLSEIPIVGNISIGHQKEFFSIEKMSSSNDVVFMERSLGDHFMPTRNAGLTIFNNHWDGRISWGAGVYRPTDGFGSSNQTQQGNFNLTGRVIGTPWYKDQAHLLAIGSSFSRRDPDNSQVRFDAKPESKLADPFTSTGLVSDVPTNLVSSHSISSVLGPLSFQGEYMASRTRGTENMIFEAYYGQISYFLTGEHRRYDGASGSYDGALPNQNFNLQKKNGTGAFEVALRYSTIDLNGEFSQGGKMTDITAGLNWYLNPNSRLMFNYVMSNLEDSGRGNIFQTRMQVTF